MLAKGSTEQKRQGWVAWAFSLAGLGLLVVQMGAAMEYVQSGLRQGMASAFGILPTAGMIVLRAGELALLHCGQVSTVLATLPLAAMPFVLVAIGLAYGRSLER